MARAKKAERERDEAIAQRKALLYVVETAEKTHCVSADYASTMQPFEAAIVRLGRERDEVMATCEAWQNAHRGAAAERDRYKYDWIRRGSDVDRLEKELVAAEARAKDLQEALDETQGDEVLQRLNALAERVISVAEATQPKCEEAQDWRAKAEAAERRVKHLEREIEITTSCWSKTESEMKQAGTAVHVLNMIQDQYCFDSDFGGNHHPVTSAFSRMRALAQDWRAKYEALTALIAEPEYLHEMESLIEEKDCVLTVHARLLVVWARALIDATKPETTKCKTRHQVACEACSCTEDCPAGQYLRTGFEAVGVDPDEECEGGSDE